MLFYENSNFTTRDDCRSGDADTGGENLETYDRIGSLLAGRMRTQRRKQLSSRMIEQQLRIKNRAMDTAVSAMTMVDLAGVLLYANMAARSLWGYDQADDLQEMRAVDFWHDCQAAQRIMKQTMESSAWSGELIARKKDGSLFGVQLNANLIIDDQGKPLAIFCSCIDISDRKQAETELRRSEERYRRIAEAVTDYIYTLSLANDQPVRTASCPVCEAVTGYTPAEFDGNPELWAAITSEEDRESVRTHTERLLQGKDPGPIQHRIRRKDGTLRWVNRLPVPRPDPDGVVRSYDVLVRDITDRKLAEEELRDSKTRFRQIADLLPQPLYEADENDMITFANRTGLQMFGYTEEDVRCGIRIIDLVAPEDRDRTRENADAIRQGRSSQGNEYSMLRKNGTTFPAIVLSAPIIREDRPVGLRGIVIDITERVQAEDVLRDTALKFRQLAETISEAFFIKDAHSHRTLYVSPAYESIWGRTCQSLYDDPESFREWVWPEDRERVVAVLEQQDRGVSTELEYRIIRSDGAIRWIRSKTFPVRSTGGAVCRIVGVAEDITARRTVEEEIHNYTIRLQALSSRLADVRESERRYIARELHDEIGQLATGLKLGLDLLAKTAGAGPAPQVHALQVMAGELISEVRNLSLGLRPSMLDDLGLLPALTWLFKRSEDQIGIAVEFRHAGIARRFPPDVETVIYRSAQEAITNAMRHADVDAISVALAADAGSISLILADRGKGFDPKQALASPESTGLFAMQERVDAVGGSLNIASTPGAGTTITIRIPFEPTAQERKHGHYNRHR